TARSRAAAGAASLSKQAGDISAPEHGQSGHRWWWRGGRGFSPLLVAASTTTTTTTTPDGAFRFHVRTPTSLPKCSKDFVRFLSLSLSLSLVSTFSSTFRNIGRIGRACAHQPTRSIARLGSVSSLVVSLPFSL